MSPDLPAIAQRVTALLAGQAPGEFLAEEPQFSADPGRPAVALRVERLAPPALLAERLELVRRELGEGWRVELYSKAGREQLAERSHVLVISGISAGVPHAAPRVPAVAIEPGRGTASPARAPSNSARSER